MEVDEKYMTLALEEAKIAVKSGEIPIGCIIVAGGQIVGRGHNLTQTLQDVTAHAEMQVQSDMESTNSGRQDSFRELQ